MNLREHETITGEIRALLKDTNERINQMAAERMRSSEKWEKQFNKESEKWRKEFDANNAAWEKRSKAIDFIGNKLLGTFSDANSLKSLRRFQ